MGEANPSVLVIDDDAEFRDSVVRLLRTVGLQARQFSSVPDYLKADPPERLHLSGPRREDAGAKRS